MDKKRTKQIAISLPEDKILELKEKAKNDQRSLSNFIAKKILIEFKEVSE